MILSVILSLLSFPATIRRCTRLTDPVLYPEVKSHVHHMKICNAWCWWVIVNISTSRWRLTHRVSQPVLLHSIRPSPCSTSPPEIISPQSHSYCVVGCFPHRFRLPRPSVMAGSSASSVSCTVWANGLESTLTETPGLWTSSPSLLGFEVGLKEGSECWQKLWVTHLLS